MTIGIDAVTGFMKKDSVDSAPPTKMAPTTGPSADWPPTMTTRAAGMKYLSMSSFSGHGRVVWRRALHPPNIHETEKCYHNVANPETDLE